MTRHKNVNVNRQYVKDVKAKDVFISFEDFYIILQSCALFTENDMFLCWVSEELRFKSKIGEIQFLPFDNPKFKSSVFESEKLSSVDIVRVFNKNNDTRTMI